MVVGCNPVLITLILFLFLSLAPSIVYRKVAAGFFQYLVRYKQYRHQSGKPGKVMELKICLKTPGEVIKFIKKMVKS